MRWSVLGTHALCKQSRSQNRLQELSAVGAVDTAVAGRHRPSCGSRTAGRSSRAAAGLARPPPCPPPVSPDGESIVFDFLGDLFTIPIAGGDATQLTSGMAFDAQPRFSPDGSRIVYKSDADGGQNVWVMASDGSDLVQMSKDASNRAESPEWMPDGDYVVAAMGAFRLSGFPLKLFHVDGGRGVQLIAEPDNLKTLGPAVSPDGRYIWYSRRTRDWQYNAQLPQLSHRGHAHVHRAADPRRGAVARRRAHRVHRPRPPVGGRRGRGQPAAADRRRPVRALPRVVAGRGVDLKWQARRERRPGIGRRHRRPRFSRRSNSP